MAAPRPYWKGYLRLSLVSIGVELYPALARAFWVADLYLFTADAAPFWRKLGFADIELEDWREPARACWQWSTINERREWAQSIGLRTMWMPAME